MLHWLIQRSKERGTAIEDLCKHLKRMGLDATVESKWSKNESAHDGNLLGSVKIANRNIDLMELWWRRWGGGSGEDNYPQNEYRCHYVVKAKMDGLVESQPIIKGLSRETVDFKWEGKELAQVLNSDANLRKLFLSKGLKSFLHVEIIPYGEHKCIIRQKFATYSVKKTFPTTETFETLDRIAHHIRSISNVSL